MALLAPPSPFVALNALQLMDNLLMFPVDPNSIIDDAEVTPLTNQRLCRQIAQDKPFMAKLLHFILKNMSAHIDGMDEWTDLEHVAFYGRFLLKSLVQSMGGVDGPTVTIRVRGPQFLKMGKRSCQGKPFNSLYCYY